MGTTRCLHLVPEGGTGRLGSKSAQDRTAGYGSNLAIRLAERDEASAKIRHEADRDTVTRLLSTLPVLTGAAGCR